MTIPAILSFVGPLLLVEACSPMAEPMEGMTTLPGPHGGTLAMTENLHAELVPTADGLMFFLYDVSLKPLPVTGVMGRVAVQGAGSASSSKLLAMGDALHAPLTLPQGPVTVSLTVSGREATTTFPFTFEQRIGIPAPMGGMGGH